MDHLWWDSFVARTSLSVAFPDGQACPSYEIFRRTQLLDHLWSALSDGGSEGRCGWLKDRWGMSWQIVPRRLHELLADANPDRARRATEAMLRMSKLNIAELERAAEGC